MEEVSNLLDRPSFEELNTAKPDFLQEDEWYDIDISDKLLNPAKKYVRPDFTLACDGVPFAPLGGIHALTGQAGHGKTMTFTQFIVAILKGRYGNLTYELKDKIPKPSVLYIDTEMEEGNTQLVNLRVYSLMSWTFGEKHDEFQILMLRDTEKAEDRWRATLKALDMFKPTVCFIDGLLDVVRDFNDNSSCQELIYKCMKAASHYKISLWCLVHENPGSTKMVGHLGSMLERKVTDSFCTVKERNDKTGEAKFTVKQKKARGEDIRDWQFFVMKDISHFGIPKQIEDIRPMTKEEQEQKELRDLDEQIRSCFENPKTGCEYMTNLEIKLMNCCHIGKPKAKEKIDRAIDLGIIRKEGKKYAYNGLTSEFANRVEMVRLFNPNSETRDESEAPF